MLESFKIENFRGFKKLELDSLNHVNLIIGKNNVGKTAVLEAMFLLMGATNPSLTFILNGYRKFEFLKLESEELWGWFFHYHKTEIPIVLEAKDKSNHSHRLEITLESSKTTEINPIVEIKDTSFNDQVNKELKFNYKLDNNSLIENKAIIKKNSVEMMPTDLVFPLSIYLTANQRGTSRENAERYSKLRDKGEHHEVIEMMKIIESDLNDLVISYTGGNPNIVADIGKKILIPVNIMGDGMSYFLSIVLAITSVQNGGCLFIDEIDNGLHYSVMQDVWKAIANYSKKFDVQIVATTHSFECIKAAQEAYKNITPYPLSVHRLEKTGHTIRAVTYDKKTLETSFELGWEIR